MYTYLLGWSQHNKYYYGVRYSKKSNPEELWKTYFSSSKHVKRFSNKHGDPDIIQVRKTFYKRDDAICWENKVLKRMNVVEDKRFLNATYNLAIKHPENYDPSVNFIEWNQYRIGKSDVELYGKITAEKKARKISNSSKLAWKNGRMNSAKPEDTTNYKAAAVRRWNDPSFKEKAKSRKWINDGAKSKMILPEEMNLYLESGWVLGRVGG